MARSASVPSRGRPRVPLVLPVAVALGLLAACVPSGTAPSGSPVHGAAAGRLAELHTWGGMCPEGPCTSTLTVRDDGRWAWSDEARQAHGVLSQGAVDRLRDAVAQTSLVRDGVTADAGRTGTVRCEADFDGRSVRVGWAADGQGWTEVSSCERPLDPEDPLVVHLDQLDRRLAP